MEKAKTFEQMLKAYNAIRKQVIDAKLSDITSVEINEYNDPSRHRHWTVIEVNIGVGGDFPTGECRYIRIEDDRFDNGMADFKDALAERINQTNN